MARSPIGYSVEAIFDAATVVTVCAHFLKKLNKYQEFDVFPDVADAAPYCFAALLF